MPELARFHTELYRLDAIQLAAEKYAGRASVDLTETGSLIVASVQPLANIPEDEVQALVGEFCNEALLGTARRLRDDHPDATQDPVSASCDVPPWALLGPYHEGSALGLGWTVESLSPIGGGAATLVLRHECTGMATVAIRRNGGAPRGIVHTDQLDFLLMNGGSSTAPTEASIARVLAALANALRTHAAAHGIDDASLAGLQPHDEMAARSANGGVGIGAGKAAKRITPTIDLERAAVGFEFDDALIPRQVLYDAVLAFGERCFIFLGRSPSNQVIVEFTPRHGTSSDVLKALARDATKALNQVADRPIGSRSLSRGLTVLQPRHVDLDAVLDELAAADPATAGVGFQHERGPTHENFRVLNIRGTGACDSDCLFCVEKFQQGHRLMPSADATRELIIESAGKFDLLFFAAGEPTIHPKLFEYVELARSVGFTRFGMSSHFRTFADPHFALKTLRAGFEYFDISLHAADAENQLAVNPIGDAGRSLFEALQGLANLQRLAELLGVRISVTHKIVVSRLSVLHLYEIFRATYDRGVRHFILQPVRTVGLDAARQHALEISEDELMPHLNELLRRTEGLGAVVKPYGLSRTNLIEVAHVEHEQNRVKNIYGRSKSDALKIGIVPPELRDRPAGAIGAPTVGRFTSTIIDPLDRRFAFPSDGQRPVLDDGMRAGLELMYGCRMGACGMCCAVLVDGTVDQSAQIFLSDEQVRAGYVLMCQARPLSDLVLRICSDDEIDQL
jgi:ferredoxin